MKAILSKQSPIQQEDSNGEKKRASISKIVSKNTGQANDDIESLQEAKNKEIISSLDNESFYD